MESDLAVLKAEVASLKSDRRHTREMVLDLELAMRNMYTHARAAQCSQQVIASAVCSLSSWQSALRDAMTHVVDDETQIAVQTIAESAARADATPLALNTVAAVATSAANLAAADIEYAAPVGDVLAEEGSRSDSEIAVGVYIADEVVPRFHVNVTDGATVNSLRESIHTKVVRKFGPTTAGQVMAAPLNVRGPRGVPPTPLGSIGSLTFETLRHGVTVGCSPLPRSMPGTPLPAQQRGIGQPNSAPAFPSAVSAGRSSPQPMGPPTYARDPLAPSHAVGHGAGRSSPMAVGGVAAHAGAGRQSPSGVQWGPRGL